MKEKEKDIYLGKAEVDYDVPKFAKTWDEYKEKWEEFRQYCIDYRFKMSGHNDDRRYCVALSITDILKKMDEIEEKM